MRGRSLLWAFLLSFPGVLSIYAQPVRLQFEPIGIEGDVSLSIVHSIIESKDGFIWFGSVDGLARYDGYSLKLFANSEDDTNSLSSNAIRSIIEDRNGFIWAGTQEGGLNKFDQKTQRFKRYYGSRDTLHGFTGTSAWKILEDSEGNLWIGTWNHGLFRTKSTKSLQENERFTCYKNIPSQKNSLSHDIVREIYEDSHGTIWIGTQGGGLNRYNKKTDNFTIYQHSPHNKKSLSNNSVYCVFEDSENRLWVGTSGGGLNLYNAATETFSNYSDEYSEHIDAIVEIKPGYLLIGTENGLRIFEISSKKFFRLTAELGQRNELNYKLIRTTFKDSQSIIWVGTEHGVYKSLVIKEFLHIRHDPENTNSLSHNIVRAITEEPDGTTWAATIGRGLNRYDPKTHQWMVYKTDNSGNGLKSNGIQSLLVDSKGTLWCGTMNGYLQRYHKATNTFSAYLLEPDPINTPNFIQGIVEDAKGFLWIGTENGLCRFNPKTLTWDYLRHNPKNPHSLSGNNIQSKAIYFDAKGNLWVGTWNNGLNFIAKDELYKEKPKVKHWKTSEEKKKGSFSNNNVLAIHEDKKGIMWLGTYGGGLNRFDPNKEEFFTYTTENGLAHNVVFGILEDREGNLWLSTSNGLSKFDPVTEKFSNFYESDGLQGNAFFWGASYQNKDGWMYFGGQNGFNKFKPENITVNTVIPRIVITNFKVYNKDKDFGKALSELSEVKLSYRDNYITIHFAALDYANPSRNKFKYKLEGFDKEWIESGNQQFASYTNLPGGVYTFRVIGSNHDNTWNNQGTFLKIRITPPIYQLWWVRILFLISIALLLYFIYLSRVTSFKNQSLRLKQMVDGRTKELNTANCLLEAQKQEILQQKNEVEMQRNKILEQKQELELHRNHLESLIEIRTDELAKAKNRAEESDKIKTSFLANMSHEIRTPLNAIVGFSNLLDERGITPEERKEYVELINRNTDTLLVLVNDILDLSSMEADQLKLHNHQFSLNEFIDDITNYYKTSYSKSNVEFRVNHELRELNQTIFSDSYRLKQILTNLLNNAFKFTEQGFIEFSCKKNNENILISVKDTGIGISKENQEIIFERFRKIEDNTTKLYRGSGLGLAISVRLCDLMKCRLWLESESEKGSTFFLEIPLGTKGEKVSATHNKKSKNETPDWTNKKILIVEDETANYQYLKSLLKKTKSEFVWAQDGQVAVNYFLSGKSFDVVLMDIKMPIMSGFDATAKIKAINPMQVIIAQTAYAMPQDVERIQNAGFDDYLAKPINPSLFYEVVGKYLTIGF